MNSEKRAVLEFFKQMAKRFDRNEITHIQLDSVVNTIFELGYNINELIDEDWPEEEREKLNKRL
jgi:hypothetical protein